MNHRAFRRAYKEPSRSPCQTQYCVGGSGGAAWAGGLVHEWLLNEEGASPGNSLDSAGSADLTELGTLANANDGTLGVYVRDNVAKTGTLETAKANVSTLYGQADFSVSYWYWHNQLVSDAVIGPWGSPGGYCWYIRQRNTGKPELHYSSDGMTDNSILFGAGLAAQTWANVILTYDYSATQFELFEDGTSYGTVSTALFDTPANFDVFSRTSGQDEFEGRLSTIRVWDKVLSADEIAALAAEY